MTAPVPEPDPGAVWAPSQLPTLPRLLRDLLHTGMPHAGLQLAVRRVWPADLADPHTGYAVECETPAGAVAGIVDGQGARLLTEDEAARTLPGLREWRQAGGRVIAHRAGKRAVLAMPDGSFVKLAKKSATRRALARSVCVDTLLQGRPAAPARPVLLDHDAGAGRLRLSRAPGVALDEVLRDPDMPRVEPAARAVADALTALAGVTASDRDRPGAPGGLCDLPVHTGAEEARILRSWTRAAALAAPAGVISAAQMDRLLARGVELAERLENHVALRIDVDSGQPGVRAVLAHRDLHEGQILVDARTDTAVTVLDWDTAAWTHPALDVANLLAHVQRGHALHDAPGWRLFEASLLWQLADRGHPAVTTRTGRDMLALLRDVARLRVFAVHAFRPGPLDVAALN